ncbi:MAG: metallophosphoesterase [Eubacteriales bacterium]
MKKTILAVAAVAVVALMIAVVALTNRAAGMPPAQAEADQTQTDTEAPVDPEIASSETPAPTATPEPEPTTEPASEPTTEPKPFSIAWISDTQEYTADDNEVLGAMTQWIADTQDEYNTVAVVHTGDIVYNAYRAYQWENFTAAFGRLPEGMCILTAAGNHDFLEKNDPNTPYLDYRPDTDVDPAHAFDESGYVYYATFTAGGVNVLLFSLSYGYEVAASEWINETCARYPDHYAILCLHTYVDAGGYSSVGKRLIEGVVKQSPNIRLVLCGHARGTAYRPEEIDDDGDGKADRTVHQMMMNTQDDQDKGIGFLRILRFDPINDTIEVVTYSPWLDRYGYGDMYDDRFGEVKLLDHAGIRDLHLLTGRGLG